MLKDARLWVLKHSGVGFTAIAGITRQTTEFTRLEYFSTQMNVIMHYIFLVLCPARLNLDYDFPISEHLLTFPTWISFITIVVLLFFAVRWWRKNTWISFGILWFLITLFPESSIFPLSDVIFEHRLYLPLVGFVVILSGLLMKISSKRVLLACLALIIMAYSGLTVARNLLWADPKALLYDTISKSPYRLRPIYNLESMYAREGDFEKAQALLDEAFGFAPEYPATHFKMGNLLLQQGKEQEAYNHFALGAEAAQSLIAAASAWRAGVLSERGGRTKMAEEVFLKSIQLDPRHESAHIDLGNIYNTQGRYDEAKEMYARAIHITPFNPNGYNGLATVLVMEGDIQKGIEIYQEALELMPDEKILENNLFIPILT
jgi:tetratricopeptide (TPR) repeat protein